MSVRRKKAGGQNVMARVNEDMQRYRNEQFVKDQERVKHSAEWHAHIDQNVAANATKRASNVISEELQRANDELKIRRRAMLKELYEEEEEQIRKELDDMGLCLYEEPE